MEVYAILGNVLIPASVFCWFVAFTNLIYPEKKKLLLIVYFIIGIIFEIIFFTLLIIDPSLIGMFAAESALVQIDIEYKTFILGYLLFIDATILITGIIFS